MLGYTVQTGDSGDKPRSQQEAKKEVSSKSKKGTTAAKVVKPGRAAKNGRAIKAATKKERAR
jgi:hypothetical protein